MSDSNCVDCEENEKGYITPKGKRVMLIPDAPRKITRRIPKTPNFEQRGFFSMILDTRVKKISRKIDW